MTEDDVRTELQRLASRRQEATEQHREASAELRAAVQRAMDEKIPVAEIARLAGVSRQGLYKIMRAH